MFFPKLLSLLPSRPVPRGSSVWILAWVGLLCAAPAPPAEAAAFGEPTYTAQRKPRVAVMEFEDTNAVADSARFGPSVSAMLVTYLKRESQLVVVERQELDQILDEWERNQKGQTKLGLSSADAQLLETIDVILQGNVTVLHSRNGQRIEIDAKLLSRNDGRIITAAQRSGPEMCLRQVVNRLGVALEQNYLRPYYGNLRVSLNDPVNTHFYLTPVLRSDALDEEKPPVELSATVFLHDEYDARRTWVTNPTTLTIEHVLSGWYVLRLDRPGYRGAGIDANRFQVMGSGQRARVVYRTDDGSWIRLDSPEMDPEIRKFLVRVQPLTTSEIDATALGFQLPKKQGSLMLAALDENSRPLLGGRVILRSIDLEINPGLPDPSAMIPPPPPPSDSDEAQVRPPALEELMETQEELDKIFWLVQTFRNSGENQRRKPNPEEAEEGKRCELLRDESPDHRKHSPRKIRTGSSFQVDGFDGGSLAFEDYRGEKVPAGTYEVVIWSPSYVPLQTLVNVSDGTPEGEPRFVHLERKSRTVKLLGETESEIHFAGVSTGHEDSVRLDSDDGFRKVSLPVDHYRVSAEMVGFPDWNEELDLLPEQELPPSLEDFLDSPLGDSSWADEESEEQSLPIKDRVWVGGRVGSFLEVPPVYYDERIGGILDRILSVSNAQRQLTQLQGGENDLLELERRLHNIDLLILDENDLSRMRVLPEAAAVVRAFVESGHALMAFITRPGDYRDILGVPLEIPRRSRRPRKMTLRPGKVSGFRLDETIRLGTRRRVPKLKERKHLNSPWRVLGYAKKGKRPCLVESVSPEGGGYVMVWLDSAFARAGLTLQDDSGGGWGRWLGRALLGVDLSESQDRREGNQQGESPEKKKALDRAERSKREIDQRLLLLKARVKNRALAWAEYLMYRRLDGDPEVLEKARARITGPGPSRPLQVAERSK